MGIYTRRSTSDSEDIQTFSFASFSFFNIMTGLRKSHGWSIFEDPSRPCLLPLTYSDSCPILIKYSSVFELHAIVIVVAMSLMETIVLGSIRLVRLLHGVRGLNSCFFKLSIHTLLVDSSWGIFIGVYLSYQLYVPLSLSFLRLCGSFPKGR